MSCHFCKILEKNDYQLYRDEVATILLDYAPISKGHFHLHVFPRFSKEEFGWTYAEEVESAATQYDTLKELFREDLVLAMKK